MRAGRAGTSGKELKDLERALHYGYLAAAIGMAVFLGFLLGTMVPC